MGGETSTLSEARGDPLQSERGSNLQEGVVADFSEMIAKLPSLEKQKAIILVPYDFPLPWAKRIRSKWLDDCTSSGAKVKSRLVDTEVAFGNRDDCFAGTPAEGSALGAIERKETCILRRYRCVCTRADR